MPGLVALRFEHAIAISRNSFLGREARGCTFAARVERELRLLDRLRIVGANDGAGDATRFGLGGGGSLGKTDSRSEKKDQERSSCHVHLRGRRLHAGCRASEISC